MPSNEDFLLDRISIDKAKQICFYFIGAMAIIGYGLTIYLHTYNMPKWDDFPEILQFLDLWLSANTVHEKYLAFISQTNEHILLVNHLIVLAQYYLIGHLNFAWLIYIGNIFYINSAIIIWLFFIEYKERAYIFSIVMLCCVTFYPYDSTLWAMTAISNQAVISFSLLAVYCATRHKVSLPLTGLFAFLAVFSQSNGLLILPVIGASLYSDNKKSHYYSWLVFSIAVTTLYIFWYNPASQTNNTALTLLHEIPWQNFLLIPLMFISYFGANPFEKVDATSVVISFFTGVTILSMSFLILRKGLYSKPVILILAFLILTIVSIAAYRGLIAGPQVIFTSRYKMYGAYFITCAILLSPFFILKAQENLYWKSGILFFSLLYFIWSFVGNIAQERVINNDLYQSLQRWVEDGDFRHAKGFFIKNADSYLFSAIKNQSYNPIVLLPTKNRLNKITALHDCPAEYNNALPITTRFDITHQNPNAAAIKMVSSFDTATTVSVTLCSITNAYEVEFIANQKTGENETYYIARENIAPGTYDVYIKNGDDLYQLEAPFKNKYATR